MENIDSWELKFQPCEYSDKLLNLITELNKMAKVPVNILEIKKACYYAREYHGDQKRKSGESYYSHPLIVAYLFTEYVSENAKQYYATDLIIIAILHDTIEDTKLTYEMITIIFGKKVADGVQDLSRITINNVKTSAGDTLLSLYSQGKYDLLLVKIFDRMHNTKTLEFKSLDKRWKTVRENIIFFIPEALNLNILDISNELEKSNYEAVLMLNNASFKDISLPINPSFSIFSRS